MARVVDLRKGKAQPARGVPLPFSRNSEPPRRVSPLKQKRRRARLAALGMLVIASAALAYAVHAISYLESLSIHDIRIAGVEKIEPSIIKTYVESKLADEGFRYFSKRNIFLYPRAEIETGIVAAFPRVKTAQLSRAAILSQELVVSIEEREQYALWCKPLPNDSAETGLPAADCYALDESGLIFTALATSTEKDTRTIYRFTGGVDSEPIGTHLVPKYFAATLALLQTLQNDTGLIPYHIELLRDEDFHVHVSQGFYIKMSLGQDGLALSRNLELVLASDALRDRIGDIEYVDMRFGNRVYYKMKGGEQSNI